MGSMTVPSRGQYLLQAQKLFLQETSVPSLKVDEVQIAPRSTTLCGSDLHYYRHGRNGSILIKEPLCLGHESAGEVVGIGSEVKHLQIGDRVAIECGLPCSDCDLCQDGRYNLCPKLRFRGSGSAFPHFQGTLQEKVNHPAAWVHKLPDCLSFDDGALLEPLSVACHVARRAQVNSNSNCLIIGAGPVGLLCAAVAKSKGCTRITICDIDAQRVKFALEYKFAEAGYTVPRRTAANMDEEMASARTLASEIANLTHPDGSNTDRATITFECTGVPSSVQTSIFATQSGGRVMLVGMGTPNHTLPLSDAGAREIDLMPTWRYANCYGEAIELMTKVAQGTFEPDIRNLITHHFDGLDSVGKAFETASRPVDDQGRLVIKVVVRN